MTKPVLCYWRVRSRAEPIRYLLHYKKVDFEDKTYSIDANGYQEWQKDKFTLGLDFPNLPYYMEGDFKLTQSVAIIRYLGYRHGLVAKTDEQHRRSLLAEQQSVDFREKLKSFAKADEHEKTGKEEFLKTVQPMLQQWETFLGNRKFIVGDDITYVDFMVFEAFAHCRLYHDAILDDYPSLRDYFNRIENLPELQGYMKSSDRMPWPISNMKA